MSSCRRRHTLDNSNEQQDLLQAVNNIQLTVQLLAEYTQIKQSHKHKVEQELEEQLIPAAVLIALELKWWLDYSKGNSEVSHGGIQESQASFTFLFVFS